MRNGRISLAKLALSLVVCLCFALTATAAETYKLAMSLAITGPTSVILEWDVNIPPLERLLEEAAAAREIYDEVCGETAGAGS